MRLGMESRHEQLPIKQINFHNKANFIRNKLARTHKYQPPNFESRAEVISTKHKTSLLRAGIAQKNLIFN
jgi:hypothetical protein